MNQNYISQKDAMIKKKLKKHINDFEFRAEINVVLLVPFDFYLHLDEEGEKEDIDASAYFGKIMRKMIREYQEKRLLKSDDS